MKDATPKPRLPTTAALSRLALWALLAAPAVVAVGRYAAGDLSYGEAIHVSGAWSVRLLIVVLAVTPLRLAFPRAAWTSWLARRRRDLGVATFAYALLHLAIYLGRKAEMPILILREGLDPGMAVGWIAFLLFGLLAATSNDASVRLLRRGWNRLHRLVYPAAALTIAHWVMTAFDPLAGWAHGGVLVALEATRLALQRRRSRAG